MSSAELTSNSVTVRVPTRERVDRSCRRPAPTRKGVGEGVDDAGVVRVERFCDQVGGAEPRLGAARRALAHAPRVPVFPTSDTGRTPRAARRQDVAHEPRWCWLSNGGRTVAIPRETCAVTTTQHDLPPYHDLIYPTIAAVAKLGGSAQAREITDAVLDLVGFTDEQVAITYENRPKSILIDRIDWARSYAKLAGLLDRPARGLYVMSSFGKEILALPEDVARERVLELNRDVRAARIRERSVAGDESPPDDEEVTEDTTWRDHLLSRLHALSPDAFEEFVLYVLRAYGLELTRVGGTGDEGIDGIGLAPISAVLSSRVAVQAKRYDPTSTVGRETVALFQRDASAAGTERAVLVTLGRFSEPARKAGTAATPTVDLVDGDRLCDLVREKEIGLRIVPQVDDEWFGRFEG